MADATHAPSQRWLPRVLSLFAFAVVVTVAPWAAASPGAAVYEQCERILMSIPTDATATTPMSAVPEESLFSELTADADEDDCDGLIIERSGQVPICLLEGASAVADRPIHDVDGTAIEADDGSCFEMEAPDQVTAPSEEMPREMPQASAQAIRPTVPTLAEPAAPIRCVARRPHTQTEPTAPSTRVFRPPRG